MAPAPDHQCPSRAGSGCCGCSRSSSSRQRQTTVRVPRTWPDRMSIPRMAPATPAVEPDTSARPDDPAAHLAADEPTIQALRRGSRARPSDSPCRRRAWHDPPSTLPRTSRGGITTGVLAEDGVRLPFRHDLIRDAIYGDVALAAEAARP